MIEYTGKIWIESDDSMKKIWVYKVTNCHFPGEFFSQEILNYFYFREKSINFEIIDPHSERRKEVISLLSEAFEPPELKIIVKMPYIDGAELSDSSYQRSDTVENIGYIATLDALVGNFDRFPLLARSEGNLGNILVDKNGYLYPIDGTCLNVESELYHNKLEYFISNIFEIEAQVEQISILEPTNSPGWGPLDQPWLRLTKFLLVNTDLNDPNMEATLKRGALRAIRDVITLGESFSPNIDILPTEYLKYQVLAYKKMFTDTIKLLKHIVSISTDKNN